MANFVDGFMTALKFDDNQAGKATSKRIDLCVEDELCDCRSLLNTPTQAYHPDCDALVTMELSPMAN